MQTTLSLQLRIESLELVEQLRVVRRRFNLRGDHAREVDQSPRVIVRAHLVVGRKRVLQFQDLLDRQLKLPAQLPYQVRVVVEDFVIVGATRAHDLQKRIRLLRGNPNTVFEPVGCPVKAT